MAEEKTYMPAGIGGLMRFGEEEEPIIKIKPKHVIFVIVAVVVLEIGARIFF
jgi:preprotein translocase subunit Sec61beta